MVEGMDTANKQGRPKASSRETLSEAACELFLEKGYDATSVSDITARAGVSRSSFFNYFAAKSDVIWAGFDQRIEALGAELAAQPDADATAGVRSAVGTLTAGFAPDALALALSNPAAMHAESELEREGALRSARIGRAVGSRFKRAGVDSVRATALGAAYGAAILAATQSWSRDGSGRAPLADRMAEAIAVAESFALA